MSDERLKAERISKERSRGTPVLLGPLFSSAIRSWAPESAYTDNRTYRPIVVSCCYLHQETSAPRTLSTVLIKTLEGIYSAVATLIIDRRKR